ncbi:MAG: N-acetylmuramoyl-L-alanine amidase [Terriglobia bacterium]|nr:N-acetylmuramoyl-L-alanine amidase [Terriglobia bacterium]
MATLFQTRGRVLAAIALAALCAIPAPVWAAASKHERALQEFDKAETLRANLDHQRASERARKDFQRVIDAYRRVYYTSPTSVKADPSVFAVAELMAEMGHAFKDEKVLRDAIGQYEFLRKQYPGSSRRVQALFSIGQIYKELNEPDKAEDSFRELLKRYPGSDQADDAKAALAEMDHPALAKAKRDKGKDSEQAKLTPVQDKQQKKSEEKTDETSAGPAWVTGIRHWSTPDYTRVAIDLEGEVKYEAGRVPNPDRIFFDLQDTKLAASLVGKSFDVSDSFLKRIRIAQFERGTTRVVLEVDDVADYSAFLLPNPYRLIIDIHGRQPQRETKVAKATPPKNDAAAKTDTKAKAEAKLGKPAVKVEKKAEPLKSAETNKPAVIKPEAPNTVANKEAPVKKVIVEADEDPAAPKHDTTKRHTEKSTVASDESEKPIPSPEAIEKTDQKKVEVSKLEAPVIKATEKATSKPVAESVAPREAKGKKGKMPVSTAHTAKPMADGDTTLIRALGLKIGRIVVDAGHGGHDTGTIGPHGLLEKDLTLDVALRLGKLLQNRLGAEVIYTRDDDTFVPLEERTAIANQQQADLFISIHANSSSDPDARGVETYYLNFTSSPDALAVAARENAVSDKSVHELQDLVKKIALKEKIEESREFAMDVQQQLHAGLAAKSPAIRDRGVKKAPFIVLIGANMPSILAEISFLSNPTDEKRLKTPAYRQKIAEALYRGIARYANGLSGVKVATRSSGSLGQQ